MKSSTPKKKYERVKNPTGIVPDFIADEKTGCAKYGITWDDSKRSFVCQHLAEMRTLGEIADIVLQEYAIEWDLKPVRKLDGNIDEAAAERAQSVRRWVYKTINFLKSDKRMQHWQDTLPALRAAWLTNIEDRYRDSNRAARIAECMRIKEMAIKSGELNTALRALLLIKVEMDNVKGDGSGLLGGVVNNQFNINLINWDKLSLTDIDRLIAGEDPKAVIPELALKKEKG